MDQKDDMGIIDGKKAVLIKGLKEGPMLLVDSKELSEVADFVKLGTFFGIDFVATTKVKDD